MKKIFVNFVIIAVLVASLAVALPTGATALPNWDITGTWNLDFSLGAGDYLHTMTVTIFNQTNGVFSGTGVYNPDPSYTWTVTGTVSGDDITFHVVYTGTNAGYTSDATGVITSTTSMGGTWSDINGASGTWTGVGTATQLPPPAQLKLLIGGGIIKVSKTVKWTLAGLVWLDKNNKPIGMFELVNHGAKNVCHFNRFSDVVLSNSNKTVSFTAFGRCSGLDVSSGVPFVITDNGKSGDTISAAPIIPSPTTLTGGNFEIFLKP
jgi:hypothetical protein